MAITLYDLTVGCFLQTLGAVEGFLAKGLAHCKEKGIDPNEIVETRLCSRHAAVPLPGRGGRSSFGRRARGRKGRRVRAARPVDRRLCRPAEAGDGCAQSLEALKPDEVNALEGKDVIFSVRDMKMPFKAEGFLKTFSLPNFHFHATTAYDILRHKGVPLGKRDYMGRMKLAK